LVIYYLWCQKFEWVCVFIFLPSQHSESVLSFHDVSLSWKLRTFCFHQKETSLLENPGWPRVIWWFQNVFWSWFWQTWLRYNIYRPIRITVIHSSCCFILNSCS
jgi:hypothetical protein